MSTVAGFNDRTKILIGETGAKVLAAARVAIYGLGGVGAACAMDLVRSGIGHLYVVDFDIIETSNLNRLCFGFSSSVGMFKTEAFSRYAREINPSITIEAKQVFFSGEEAHRIVDETSDIHADCVDSLNAKVNLIAELCSRKSSFIASMGTAGRLAPEKLRLGTMWSTKGCPLAKSVRARLRHLGVEVDFPVVWSDEPPVKPVSPEEALATEGLPPLIDQTRVSAASTSGRKRMIQGSSPFVPQAAGHIMASWIVRELLSKARPAFQAKG